MQPDEPCTFRQIFSTEFLVMALWLVSYSFKCSSGKVVFVHVCSLEERCMPLSEASFSCIMALCLLIVSPRSAIYHHMPFKQISFQTDGEHKAE